MPYFDVLFPLIIGPLTYRCPEALREAAKAGMVVSAPIKNRLTKGIILGENISPPPGKMKELAEIHGDVPAVGKGLLKLLSWMSDYYLAPLGVVLKQTVPREIFTERGTRKPGRASSETQCQEFMDIPQSDISVILESARQKKYRTFLMHSPSGMYEYSLVPALVRSGLKNVLIVLPEVSKANFLYDALARMCGERVCLLHGGVSKGRRSRFVSDIIAGTRDIVVGTTPALFAPLKNISLIVVLQEHSGSYKLEEGIRYNVRDVAVMRGFIEKSTVLLSSVTPSVDSYFNALSGKYSIVRPEAGQKRPRVRIVDMRFGNTVRPNISRAVFDAAKSRLRAGKKMIFIVNRRGHSTLFLCGDCGLTTDCDRCSVPLVYHRSKGQSSKGVLKCHYCGEERAVPERCSRCGSHRLELLGSGTQRVQEDIEELLGEKAVRFDSDEVRKGSEIDALLRGISGGSTRVVIGTKMMTHRLAGEKFSAAVVLGIDSSLNFPDFRAAEKAYGEISSAGDLVEASGEVLIQTRFPQNSLFRHLRDGDYLSFVREELEMRKELFYPPYAKMVDIGFTGAASRAEDIARAIAASRREIEVLGPVAAKSKKAGEFSILLKSRDRNALRAAAREVVKKFGEGKERRIIIDVDPG